LIYKKNQSFRMQESRNRSTRDVRNAMDSSTIVLNNTDLQNVIIGVQNIATSNEAEDDKRRSIRGLYLKLMNCTNKDKSEIVQPGLGIHKYLEAGNSLFKEVYHSREGTLDAQWFHGLADLTVQQASHVHIGETFNVEDFIQKALGKFSSGEDLFDWEKFSMECCQTLFTGRCPSLNFMNGPIKFEARQQKERMKRKEREVTEAVNPEELNNIVQGERGNQRTLEESSRRASELYQKMNVDGSSPKPFVPFVIDTMSFSKSIENIFDFGVLVKEGRVGLINEKGKLSGKIVNEDVVEGNEEGQRGTRVNERTLNKQCILKLDWNRWNNMASKLQVDKISTTVHINTTTNGTSLSSSTTTTKTKTKIASSHQNQVTNGKRHHVSRQQDDDDDDFEVENHIPNPSPTNKRQRL